MGVDKPQAFKYVGLAFTVYSFLQKTAPQLNCFSYKAVLWALPISGHFTPLSKYKGANAFKHSLKYGHKNGPTPPRKCPKGIFWEGWAHFCDHISLP
jgi:hypothetical protein